MLPAGDSTHGRLPTAQKYWVGQTSDGKISHKKSHSSPSPFPGFQDFRTFSLTQGENPHFFSLSFIFFLLFKKFSHPGEKVSFLHANHSPPGDISGSPKGRSFITMTPIYWCDSCMLRKVEIVGETNGRVLCGTKGFMGEKVRTNPNPHPNTRNSNDVWEGDHQEGGRFFSRVNTPF